ncbi:Zinc finger protein 90 [Holothuria leucospilota]|uniref:Zinc finger protein 90 n=1 Tax=Holothuria leucospilota TaxID=206669 RepID=A0A9Q1H1B6_HOLLE|nr:Zinc finger protein 90 [Holothuria leucospilota]
MQWKKHYSAVTMTTNSTRLHELGHIPDGGNAFQIQPSITAAPQYIHIPSSQRHRIVPRTIRYSSEEKNNTCKFCGKWFFTRYATRTHEKIHTGERAFSCKFCGKRFIQSGQRNQHELTHTGERPHKCSFCGKGFQRLTHKRRHEQIHTERPPAKSQKCFPIKFKNSQEQTNDLESQVCASTQQIYYKEIPTSQTPDVKAGTSEEVVIAEIATPKTEA